METLFIYLIKSSGLVALFYVAYYFLLRKETFFTSNRWFLLAGLATSVVLPLVIFTKIIWVEPTVSNVNWSSIPTSYQLPEKTFEDYLPLLAAIAYGLGLFLLLLKFAFEYFSLNAVLKTKPVQKQADFIFIDTTDNLAPFSYFNTIVYNSSLYTESELALILEHEKVHSEQLHTIDVLISRAFCIVFWFNPFIWLYKKAVLQNLEFIADNEATKKITDKKAYQITLLKVTTHENCVAISNHFYQSLIKKRIVMLNKNQSKKWHSWKYALMFPLLAAFVFLFQINTVAQEKSSRIPEIQNVKSDSSTKDILQITKNASDKDLEEKAAYMIKNYGITANFTNLKRNAANELTAITVELKKGEDISEIMELHGSQAIKSFGIIVSKNAEGMLTVEFATEDIDKSKAIAKNGIVTPDAPMIVKREIYIDGSKKSEEELDKLDPNQIERMDVNKNEGKNEIRIISKKFNNIATENEIYINGEKVSAQEFSNLDQNEIDQMHVDKNDKTIRIITKISKQNYNGSDMPAPPVAPKFPQGPMPTPPIPDMSKMPTPPSRPVNVNDEKAMAAFEKKMKEFEKKMESFEPEMRDYEKKMQEVMTKREKIFEKEMEKYRVEMEKYREQMEKRKK